MINEFLENKLSTYGTKKTEIGIGGFTLLVNIEESIELSSDVTINYVESGDFTTDHIIKKPIKISFTGESGDIHLKDSNYFSSYKKVAAAIGKFTPYFPKRTPTQISRVFGLINTAKDTADKIDGYIKDGVGLYNILNGIKPDIKKTPQEQFIEFFTMIYEQKLYLNLEAFGKEFKDMAMTSLSIKRSESSFISYSISFTQLRFAETTKVNVKKNKGLLDGKKKGANKTQTAKKKDMGTITPAPPRDKSVLTKIKGLLQ